eukprot:SAG22_NODE_208_length_15237_cov_22.602774_9_plen_487_part_00
MRQRSSLLKAVITAFPSVSVPFLAVPLLSQPTVALSVTLLIGVAGLGSIGYALSHSEKFEVFITERSLWQLGAVPVVMILWAVFGICALQAVRSKGVTGWLCAYTGILVLVILVQTCAAFVVFVWVKDSYTIEDRTYSVLGLEEDSPPFAGTGVELIDHELQHAFDELESLLCNTYKRCCWEDLSFVENQRVSNVTTCTSSHDAGRVSAMREAAETYTDPSSPAFCALLAGKKGKGLNMVPPKGVCKAFDAARVLLTGAAAEVPVLNLQHCARDFCTEGVRGYESFVTRAFEWVRAHLLWAFGVGAFFAVGELSLFCLCCFMLHMNKNHNTTDKASASKWDDALAREEARVRAQYGGKQYRDLQERVPPPPRPAAAAAAYENHQSFEVEMESPTRGGAEVAPPPPRPRMPTAGSDVEWETETYVNELGADDESSPPPPPPLPPPRFDGGGDDDWAAPPPPQQPPPASGSMLGMLSAQRTRERADEY